MPPPGEEGRVVTEDQISFPTVAVEGSSTHLNVDEV